MIDYGAFRQPLSPLFRDYLTGQPGVAAFFAGPWNAAGIRAARAERPAAVREAVASTLVRQQSARGAPQAAEAAGRLSGPTAAAVVTGQQPGLFGGPMFVLYKALAAQKIAAAIGTDQAPAVPVFWVASDDHDFAEVRAVSVLDESQTLHSVRYAPEVEPGARPAHAVVLDDSIRAAVSELERLLPGGPHRDEFLHLVERCYAPGTSLSSAFAGLLSGLLPGLVVMDPADVGLRRPAVPLMQRELREGSPSSRLAAEAGHRLLEAGYHQQVPVRPGFLNLFVNMASERRALGIEDGVVEVRGLGRKLSVDEAAGMIESDPLPWSPGVLLRPLVQDLLLPTAAYVGGPAEIAYHAQIGPAYAHFGVHRPALVPRPSLTLVEPAQARSLAAESLALADLQEDPEAVAARWAREAYPEVEEAFANTREALEREMRVVEERLAALDPTLRAAADAAQGRALHQIGTLHEKSLRALKKRDRARTDRLRRTRDALLPGGALQERGLGLAWLLARHGSAIVDEIRERMDPWATGHQVLEL